MRSHHGFIALAALSSLAMANGNNGTDTKPTEDKVAVPPLQGANVSAEAGKGVTFDAGDDFKLNLKSYLQALWVYASRENQQNFNGATIRTARLNLSGHAFSPTTRFKLSLEGAEGTSVKDAWAQARLYEHDDWSLDIRAGQAKTLYGRETTGSLSQQMFSQYSLAARTFSGARSRGANFLFNMMDSKLRANIGTFNGDPALGGPFSGEEKNPDDHMPDYTFGVRYDHKGSMGDTSFAQGDLGRSEDWNVGVGGNLWLGNQNMGGVDFQTTHYNVNLAYKNKGISFLAEWYGASNESQATGGQSVDSTGWNVQATYALENKWAFGARYSMAELSDNDPGGFGVRPDGASIGGLNLPGNGSGDISEVTVMAGKFFNGHANKAIAEVTFQSVSPDAGTDSDNVIFTLGWALIF